MPPLARVSAAEPPAGPPPTTATRRFRPVTFGLVLAALTWSLRWFEGFREMGFAWIVKWGFSEEAWRSPMKDLRAMEAIFFGLELKQRRGRV